MKVNQKTSRLRKNQKCRQILSAAGVDLDYLSIGNMAKTITLSGKLLKIGNVELSLEEVQQIQSKLREISPFLFSDLENWDLNGWQTRKLPKKVQTEAYRDLERKKERKVEEDIIIDFS